MRAVIFSVLIALAVSACSDKTPETPPVPEGIVADLSTLSFLDFQGNPVSLATYKTGRPVVVNFWATWCAPCVRELPSLLKLQEQGQVTVITISADRKAEVAQEFLKQNNLTHLNTLWDGGFAVSRKALKVAQLPVTFLAGPDYILKATELGEREWHSPAMVAKIFEKTGAQKP
jgi:thiol-disulfide isomerase/thioredoxin